MRPNMLQKTGHFLAISARIDESPEMSIPQDFSNIFEKITANPFVSTNGPTWQLIAAQNGPNRGENAARKRGPKMLQNMGHLYRD